jgi:hypothetical protein
MSDPYLANFLDPIAKVWGDTPVQLTGEPGRKGQARKASSGRKGKKKGYQRRRSLTCI